MRSTLLSVLLAFSCFAYGSTDFVKISANHNMKLVNFDITGRIVNGTEATVGQFPYQVSLQRSWSRSHFCGGSIISIKLILAAAHCMYLNGVVIQPWTILVVGGELKLRRNSSTRQERDVKTITIHSEFNRTTLHNDIAILELSAPLKFTPEVHNIPLPGNPPTPETCCQVAGWGYPAENVPIASDDLMYVNLPIRSTEECRKLLVNVTDLPAGMLCAGYLEGGKDSCNGDSGSGMICNGILTGLVSGGLGCARPRTPGVYADIFYYMDWIIEHENVIIVHTQNFTYNNYNTRKTSTTIAAVVSFFLSLLSMIFHS